MSKLYTYVIYSNLIACMQKKLYIWKINLVSLKWETKSYKSGKSGF